jgi:hypothetical protein
MAALTCRIGSKSQAEAIQCQRVAHGYSLCEINGCLLPQPNNFCALNALLYASDCRSSVLISFLRLVASRLP